jgi:hypothetical protein
LGRGPAPRAPKNYLNWKNKNITLHLKVFLLCFLLKIIWTEVVNLNI